MNGRHNRNDDRKDDRRDDRRDDRHDGRQIDRREDRRDAPVVNRPHDGSAVTAMVAPVNANAVIEKRHREELMCGICKGIVVDAMQTKCGHLFCLKCLQQVTDQKCPLCREQPHNAREDRNAERRAKDLVRACINEDQGCTFAGDRHATVLHEARCGFVPRAVLRIQITMIENELTATKLLLQAKEHELNAQKEWNYDLLRHLDGVSGK